MRRQQLTKDVIGRQLHYLRGQKGLTFKQVADQCEKLDVAALCLFERGEQLRRLHRHAPELAKVLGDEVYLLAVDAITVLVEEDARIGDFDRRLLQVLRQILEERVGSIAGEGPAEEQEWDRGTWGPFPNMQELAERLKLVEEGEPVDLAEMNRLAESVQRLKLLRGWTSSEEE